MLHQAKKKSNVELNEQYIIKVIRKSKLDTIDLESIRNEVDIMKEINHKNIIKLITSFENFEYIYLVTEYFDNCTSLVEYIKKFNYVLEEHKISKLIKQIFEVIEFMHKKHILCRNIKTENVLVNESLDIKMSNFRLLRILGSNQLVQQEPYGAMVSCILFY